MRSYQGGSLRFVLTSCWMSCLWLALRLSRRLLMQVCKLSMLVRLLSVLLSLQCHISRMMVSPCCLWLVLSRSYIRSRRVSVRSCHLTCWMVSVACIIMVSCCKRCLFCTVFAVEHAKVKNGITAQAINFNASQAKRNGFLISTSLLKC